MKELEKILIIDDDTALAKILCQELEIVGYHVSICSDGNQALELIGQQHFDLLLLDYKMPGLDGLGVLMKLREINNKSKVIVMTGYGDVELALECSRLGASDFLSKPYDLDELLITIRKVLYSS